MLATEFLRSDWLEPLSLTIRGRLVCLDRPLVMGIVNATPDSFYAASRALDAGAAVERARRLIEEGADIVDIGACSTRPGSQPADEAEEAARLFPTLDAVRKALPEAIISVDTFRASIASRCMEEWNVEIINDITGGADPEMYDAVANFGATYVLMHNRGVAAEKETAQMYGPDVVADIVRELAFKVNDARKAGICNLIVDPGFGFSKTTEQSMEILARLGCLKVLGCPILVGISRKRMAGSLAATIALNTAAVLNGADIIRVHDATEGVVAARTAGSLRALRREEPEIRRFLLNGVLEHIK